MDASLDNPEGIKEVLEHMYLVQEFLDGGNLRKQVLEQVTSQSITTHSSSVARFRIGKQPAILNEMPPLSASLRHSCAGCSSFC